MIGLDKGEYSGKVIDIARNDGLIADVTSYFRDDDTDFAHYHENPHISFILEGGNLEKRRNGEFERHPGEIMFFRSGETHQSITKIFPARNINLEIEQSFLSANSIDESAIDFSIKKNPSAKFIMLKVYKELLVEDEFSESSMKMLFLNLICSAPKTTRRPPGWVKTISELLNDRWNENLTLNDLANAANVHPVTISKYFPKYFSCTLGEYLRKLKIDKSLRLIKASSLSLTEIAHECGFYDQSHFTKIFKQFTGFLPNQYEKI
jgi:AraC family transcriptional regulator